MSRLKVFYEITQDSLGAPINFVGARYINESAKNQVRNDLASDYDVPIGAVIVTDIQQVD